ncbi:hypothetical protein [Roseofilum casamattae]|uniref:Uncharacterized protein n=1 Tax=Roseofilum casamattae BLCC-M143 TaxID=3022442 RepID=A0ABT7BWX9_9CYAN|nr:hypothetical protein [Roseofilum casamattae]MDJ1183699.1 hypothetical protein [Roseofilum casamattae BLCC-M143]
MVENGLKVAKDTLLAIAPTVVRHHTDRSWANTIPAIANLNWANVCYFAIA